MLHYCGVLVHDLNIDIIYLFIYFIYLFIHLFSY